jgi:hypothetical protein
VSGSQQFQIESKAYIECADTNCGMNRSISGYDGPGSISDVTFNGNATYDFTYGVYGFIAPTCPFPGFNEFFNYVEWRQRQWVAALGQWTSWSSFTEPIDPPSVYAQVCI